MAGKEYGIERLYHSFCDYLKENGEKIAPLMISGRIEDYLVKEFVYHIYSVTAGESFAFVNLGKTNRREKRVDICVATTDSDGIYIYGMLEAKYLRNNHRIEIGTAEDENYTLLKGLSAQIGQYNRETHGGYRVKLKSHQKYIYGLVFAGYVSDNKNNKNDKDRFYRDIKEKAEKCGLKYHDLKEPYLPTVIFDDFHLHLLDRDFYATLKSGLWRREGNVKSDSSPQ